MGISISNLFSYYDVVLSLVVGGLFILLFSIGLFTLKSGSNIINKEHDEELFKQPPLREKKQCERHIAEIHDEELFKQPPPEEDCPICFIQIPSLGTGRTYMTCCGKGICNGCLFAPVYDDQGNKVNNHRCPFCRTPPPKTDEEIINRLTKRVEAGDAEAMYSLGNWYHTGMYDFPQDHTKALELFHRAAKLGHANAYFYIGWAYQFSKGVERDEKKAQHYVELAAIGGSEETRYYLGVGEKMKGNMDRALKHFMIAAKTGHRESVEEIRELYSNRQQLKKITQTHYNCIKSTWMELRVNRGIKLLQFMEASCIVTISAIIAYSFSHRVRFSIGGEPQLCKMHTRFV